MKRAQVTSMLGAALLAMALTVPAYAEPSIKILVPSDDNCAALVTAMNNGDTSTMLSLGGWALGFLSGIAQQTGKDILRSTTSEGLLDQLSEECQKDPTKPMSAIVEQMSSTLMANVPE